jgi:DNA-binding transcriptional ArsR family regulator
VKKPNDLDVIWKALADETRRSILDCLRDGPRTTTEIVERFPEMTRFGVMKHLQVLRDAGLVITREEGRTCMNSLNAVPIRLIYERWVSRFAEHWAMTLIGLKESLEKPQAEDPKGRRSRKKNQDFDGACSSRDGE